MKGKFCTPFVVVLSSAGIKGWHLLTLGMSWLKELCRFLYWRMSETLTCSCAYLALRVGWGQAIRLQHFSDIWPGCFVSECLPEPSRSQLGGRCYLDRSSEAKRSCDALACPPLCHTLALLMFSCLPLCRLTFQDSLPVRWQDSLWPLKVGFAAWRARWTDPSGWAWSVWETFQNLSFQGF